MRAWHIRLWVYMRTRHAKAWTTYLFQSSIFRRQSCNGQTQPEKDRNLWVKCSVWVVPWMPCTIRCDCAVTEKKIWFSNLFLCRIHLPMGKSGAGYFFLKKLEFRLCAYYLLWKQPRHGIRDAKSSAGRVASTSLTNLPPVTRWSKADGLFHFAPVSF